MAAVNEDKHAVEAWVAAVLRKELGAELEQAEARIGCEFSLNLSQDAALLLKEAKSRREAAVAG